MQPSTKCVETECKLVNELADPELTAVYAESQDKKRPASRVFLNAFRHKIMMSFVPHTVDAVQTSLLGHLILAPHVAYRKACSRTRCSHSSFV